MFTMSIKSIGENPDITLRSNRLTVNRHTLCADVLKNLAIEKLAVSADDLEKILLLGRRSILQGVEEFYEQQVIKNPAATVSRPSIWTAQLGNTTQTDGQKSKVITEQGYANRGVIASMDEIHSRFHPYWTSVRQAGFLPEVRRSTGKQDGGSWLLLRKPSIGEVLHYWFDESEIDLDSSIEAIADKDREVERRNLQLYRMLGEKAVDQVSDTLRSRKQIGLILSMAAIKSAIGDRSGYEEEVDDALTYADNDLCIDVSTVRAIENSTFEID